MPSGVVRRPVIFSDTIATLVIPHQSECAGWHWGRTRTVSPIRTRRSAHLELPVAQLVGSLRHGVQPIAGEFRLRLLPPALCHLRQRHLQVTGVLLPHLAVNHLVPEMVQLLAGGNVP